MQLKNITWAKLKEKSDFSTQNSALGLKANWRQFALLMLINGFVGAMVGMERSTLPLIAEGEFGLTSRFVLLSFLAGFGLVKALSNLFAGNLADRLGRKPLLIAGWLAGLPVPLILMFSPNWTAVIFANVLLGVNQGLCWSMTVIMKIDLAGSRQRGTAMGLNEAAGYLAASLSALLTGYLATAYGLRPVPFFPGLIFALLGTLLSIFFVRETLSLVQKDDQQNNAVKELPLSGGNLSFIQVLSLTSWKNRSMFSISQAGLVNNLNDGVVWGLTPILLKQAGLPLEQIVVIVSLYPAVWGLSQLVTGALSDQWGRKGLIVLGMFVQAIGLATYLIAKSFWMGLSASALLGLGTALVYPTLLAAVSDTAHPQWRATAVGIYRLWRDSGYMLGALIVGWVADLLGIPVAFSVVALLTFLSGMIVWKYMLPIQTKAAVRME